MMPMLRGVPFDLDGTPADTKAHGWPQTQRWRVRTGSIDERGQSGPDRTADRHAPAEVWEYLAAVRAGDVHEVLRRLFEKHVGRDWADLRAFRAV